jgi:hypothetical protein
MQKLSHVLGICQVYEHRVVRFEVFTATKIHVAVFWVAAPCSVMVGHQRFGDLAAAKTTTRTPRRVTTSVTRDHIVSTWDALLL